MNHAVVQGASRGIGLALATALIDHGGWHVTLTNRSGRAPGIEALRERAPERVRALPLDLSRPETIIAAASEVSQPIRLLLNVGGFLHDEKQQPEKRLESVEADALLRAFSVNAIGPLLVAQAFLPQLRAADRATVANLSARVGSIADNRIGGWYAYRASKAAQNMLTRTLAIELARRAPHVACVALHPGTVDTALSKPFRGGTPSEKRFTPAQAAEKLLNVIDGIGPEQSGRFFAWDGSEIPW